MLSQESEIAATPARKPYAWRIQRFHLLSGNTEFDQTVYSEPSEDLIANMRRSWRVVVTKSFRERPPEETKKLLDDAIGAAQRWANAEFTHAKNLGAGGPGHVAQCARAEDEAHAAIRALADVGGAQ